MGYKFLLRLLIHCTIFKLLVLLGVLKLCSNKTKILFEETRWDSFLSCLLHPSIFHYERTASAYAQELIDAFASALL